VGYLAIDDGHKNAAAAVTAFTGCFDYLFFAHDVILFTVVWGIRSRAG